MLQVCRACLAEETGFTGLDLHQKPILPQTHWKPQEISEPAAIAITENTIRFKHIITSQAGYLLKRHQDL